MKKTFGIALATALAMCSVGAFADTADPPSLKQGIANASTMPAQAISFKSLPEGDGHSIDQSDKLPKPVFVLRPSDPSWTMADGVSPAGTATAQVSSLNFVMIMAEPAPATFSGSAELLAKYDPGIVESTEKI